MNTTLGIISIKGGVGKTTIATTLAVDLATTYKKKVLLVDANFSAPNLGEHIDITESEKTIHHVLEGTTRIENAIYSRFGVDVIPGNMFHGTKVSPLKLKPVLEKLSQFYDFTIIDSSPNLDEETLATMLASNALFIVSTPDTPTLACSLKAAHVAKQRGTPIAGIILNKVTNTKFELSLDEIETITNIPVVAKIPHDKTAQQALFTRIPISVYDAKNKVSQEITALNAALTQTKKSTSFLKRMLPSIVSKHEVNRHLLKENFYKRIFIN
jgi:septum site-determining protein MinD